ncbi:bifunctional metallophosphatase/5'-nucleotidase [Geobacillus sp. 46C-IIa]|uniref:bifunctional metallophosphatase/5'-nucleotidase n=1 Tax=Geobacillus sp. 46C-IIa TaxID=1963025 RepID=UPI0009BEFDD8|nr:bifunctional UDP-sugar hydrolase/5'-nucleotidase [Geobacillus sp. 46C-IIa]OQP07460.1 bifunctional metallophosphatase/5'-nucleotidase [Geobacillus sp. 46C-IIa]QNU28373.1 bifunctional metallophosphatase/5'-nucleotidase [Geobacillus sp. 46C-IIa]
MKQTIYIYHTNDVHSHFEHWPQIARFLSERRREHRARNEAMLLFDVGDFLDRVHPITEATRGKANVELLNELGYDAVTIGNNEGITLDYHELDTLYERAQFPVVVANLFRRDGSRPSWALPYAVVQVAETFRVGLVGVTAPFRHFYESLGWTIAPPFEMLQTAVAEVKQQADCVVVLSHLGVNEDEKIAATIPDVDIILGSHTHHVFPEGKQVNGALLCAAGKYGQYIGVVKLEVEDGRLARTSAAIVDVATLPRSEEVERHLHRLEQESLARLEAERIAELKDDLPLNWFAPSPLAHVLASALREWCQADIGMVNAGVLLEPLAKGTVTKKDVHRICPHPLNPCKVKLRGAELKEIVLEANTERMKHLRFKGFGFRGEVMGEMVYAGVDIETELEEDGAWHIRRITINGEPLDPERLYEVATTDMFAIGHFYPQIQRAAEKTYYMPEFLRDVLAWKLAQ